MPPSEGIPPLTFLLASNTSRAPRESGSSPGLIWAHPQFVPDSVTRGQLLNPGRGPAFDPSRFIVGSEPVIHLPGNVHLRIPFRPVGACLFRRRSENGVVVGGVA
jgi:hypothetical protein